MAVRERVQVQPFDPRASLQPTAAPTGRTVQAVKPQPSAWERLATTLAEISPALQETLWQRHQAEVQEYEALAEGRLNGMTVDEARRAMQAGELYPIDNPWYRAAVNKFYGMKLGQEFRDRALADFQSWDKNGDLDEFLRERAADYYQGFADDPYATAGFNAEFSRVRSSLAAAQFDWQNTNMVNSLNEAYSMNAGRLVESYQGNPSPDASVTVSQALIALEEEFAAIGGWTNPQKNEKWFEFIAAAALRGEVDLALAAAAAPRGANGEVPPLSSIPDWADKIASVVQEGLRIQTNNLKTEVVAGFTEAGMNGGLNTMWAAFRDMDMPDGSTYTADQMRSDVTRALVQSVRQQGQQEGWSPAQTSAMEIHTLGQNGLMHPEMRDTLPQAIDRLLFTHAGTEANPFAMDEGTFEVLLQLDTISPHYVAQYLGDDAKFFEALRYATTYGGLETGTGSSFTEAVLSARRAYHNAFAETVSPELRQQVNAQVDSLISAGWFDDGGWMLEAIDMGWFTSDSMYGDLSVREAFTKGVMYYRGLGVPGDAAVEKARRDFMFGHVRINGTWTPIPHSKIPGNMSPEEFTEIIEGRIRTLANEYSLEYPELYDAFVIPTDRSFSEYLIVLPNGGTLGNLSPAFQDDQVMVITIDSIIEEFEENRQRLADEADEHRDLGIPRSSYPWLFPEGAPAIPPLQ